VSQDPVSVILFYGDHAASEPERLVSGACAAAARDMVDLALACPLVDRVVVATNSNTFTDDLVGMDRVVVERDPPRSAGETFNFGRTLQSIVERHGIRRPFYFGAGAAPLLSAETFQGLCLRLSQAERTVITNNVWSADFYGFTPPEALRRVPLPADQDNSLPRLLSRPGGGLRADSLEPAVEYFFDIDTPTDVLVLALQSRQKPHVRRFVEMQARDVARIEAVMPVLLDDNKEKALIGRVSTALWGDSRSDMPGPKRLFVEERSMKAFGRDVRGEARTLLGYFYESAGPKAFFDRLAECCDVAFLDTRVLFAHLRLQLSPADRFASDLGDVDAIQDPTARELTRAALESPVPVILGGHNIVSGALWALVQEAWDRADAGLLSANVG
jgi:hypothetical protein